MNTLEILSLIRIKDWVKNIIIFLPLIFSGFLLNFDYYSSLIIGFVIFSLISTSIYILNDILDIKSDSYHPTKKFNKPLASGKISLKFAYSLLLISLLFAIILIFFHPIVLNSAIIYLIINLFYNFGLKKIPYIEIFVISFGYIIRIDVGSKLINVESSIFIIISIYSLALFFLLLKRVGEMNHTGDKQNYKSRKVLKYYNKSTLKFLSTISLIFLLIVLLLYIININYKLIFSFVFVTYFLFNYFKLTIDNIYGENPILFIFYNKKLLITSFLSLFFSLIIYI